MKLGFTTVTFRDKSIDEIYEIANKNKIKYIEWGGDKHLPVDDSVALEKIKHLSKLYGITNYSYGSYYRAGENNPEKAEKICKLASEIGASIVRIWLGNKGSFFTAKNEFDAMVKDVKNVCKMAQKYNLIIASEFHQKTYNDCGKACLKFIEAVNMQNYKTYWQPLKQNNFDFKNLEKVVDNVVIAHIFNWRNFNERYMFDYKSERWQKFFIAMKSNKNIVGIMEFVKDDSIDNFAQDYKTIINMLEEINE